MGEEVPILLVFTQPIAEVLQVVLVMRVPVLDSSYVYSCEVRRFLCNKKYNKKLKKDIAKKKKVL